MIASLRRGIRLGVFAVIGAVLAQVLEASVFLTAQPLTEPLMRHPLIVDFQTQYGPGLDWVVGALIGAIASDLLLLVQGNTLPLGMRAGLVRGLIAGTGGVVTLVFAPAILDVATEQWDLATTLIDVYPGDERMLAFAAGIWAGAVVGDLWQR